MDFLFTSTVFQSYVSQLINGKFYVKIGIVLFAKDAHLLILVYTLLSQQIQGLIPVYYLTD